MDDQEEELKKLIEGWNMEHIFPLLKDAGVGIDELHLLIESDLDKLFPDIKSLGIKAKFRHNLENLKKSKNHSMSMSLMTEFDIDIKSILSTTASGQDVLLYFQNNKRLLPTHQQVISNFLIEKRFGLCEKITIDDFEAMRDAVIKYFDGENGSTYFHRHGKTMKPGGKLYDRYMNLRKKRRASSASDTISNTSSMSETLLSEVLGEVDESLALKNRTWLKYHDSPEGEVIDKWKKTFGFRKQGLDKPDFYMEWPLIKHPLYGIKLIECDFELLFPSLSSKFFELWDENIVHMEKYLVRTIKDKAARQLLFKVFDENIVGDSKMCILAILLNAVILPTAKYKKNGKVKKVTIKEAMDSFCCHIKSEAFLEEEINNLRSRFEQQTLQPIMVVVGDSLSSVKNFYVYFEGIKLKLSSFPKCLDICFKLFHVLNFQYPMYCKSVWLFIQKFFYKIVLPNDNPSSQVSGIISYFNSFSNNSNNS